MQFNAALQDSPLLFQFIVSECLTSFKELNSLMNLVREGMRQEQLVSREIVNTSLLRLAGSSYETLRLFSNGQHDGVLTKLKDNCALFSQNADAPDNDRMVLHLHADQAWLNCLKCLQLMQKQINYTQLLQLLTQASGYLCSLVEGIKKMIAFFCYDENVIFFILQKHKELDLFFSGSTVRELFEEIYPGGVTETSYFLVERYSTRGFSHLLPIIHEKIKSL